MSAQVIQLPEPKMRPDLPLCGRVVHACQGDEARLFETALLSLLTVYERRGAAGLTRRDIRRLVNPLCIAWMALGEILGPPGRQNRRGVAALIDRPATPGACWWRPHS